MEAASPSGAPAAFTVPSGEEVLRSALLAEKVELYSLWGKVSNCGGGGSCGTCIVEVRGALEVAPVLQHSCPPVGPQSTV